MPRWLLSAENASEYCLRSGLLSRREFVAGGYEFRAQYGRNASVHVVHAKRRGYVLKMSAAGGGDESFVRREAEFYEAVWESQDALAIRRWIPRFVRFDRHRAILVVELIPRSIALAAAVTDKRIGGVIPADALGTAFADIHSTRPIPSLFPEPMPANVTAPWISTALLGSNEIGGRFASSEIPAALLDRARGDSALVAEAQGWNSPSRPVLVHGDAKATNVVVALTEARQLTTDVRIVDWELATTGDAAWDLAGIVQSLVIVGLTGLNAAASADVPGEALQRFRDPSTGVAGFVSAYLAARRDEFDRLALLRRTVGAVSIRLVQTALEAAQFEASIPLISDQLITVASRFARSADDLLQFLHEEPACR